MAKGNGKQLKAKKNTVCIMCTKTASGIPVNEDYVISTIRWVKRKLNAEKGNTLVVCKECMETYKKRRADFERSLLMYGGAGVVILIILLLINLSISSFIAGILLLLFMLVLAHIRYVPKLSEGK